MLSLNLTADLVDFDSAEITDKLKEIKKTPPPDFANHQPPLEETEAVAEKFASVKNIILIGNGGSRNSSWAFYHALPAFTAPGKTMVFVNTMEPDFLTTIREQYPPESSMVVVVSKSGTNVDMLEPLLYFLDYPTLAVTGPDGVLLELAERKKWPMLPHPDISGRFTGITTSALAPLCLAGVPINEIVAGAKQGYADFDPQKGIEYNSALKLATFFYLLEKQGYIEIFTAFYSYKLFSFFPLLVQLIHESLGKNLQGPTIFGDLAPESQHHTNQRFFGGRKNVSGLFWTVTSHDNQTLTATVPPELNDIKLRSGKLGDLNDLNFAQGLLCDFRGVLQDAEQHKIPYAHLSVDRATPKTMGYVMSFMQYFTFYSALLRGVDPFDQPQVERAKDITFELIKNRK